MLVWIFNLNFNPLELFTKFYFINLIEINYYIIFLYFDFNSSLKSN